MLRRLFLVPVVVLLAVLATGCAKDVSPAVRVADVKVSDADLLDEVAEWANNPAAYPPEQLATHNPGTYPMELVTAILGQRIDLELHHEEFEARALDLTDDLRNQAVSLLFQGDMEGAQRGLGGFTDAYRERYVDAIAEQLAVQDALGPDYGTWRADAYREADVQVSPRYGTWDGTNGQVIPPEGPAQPVGNVDFGG